MRKTNPVAAAADPPGREDRVPVQLVCLALLLSLIVLACRIASIW